MELSRAAYIHGHSARKIFRHRTADQSANRNNTGHTSIYVSECEVIHTVTKGTYRAVCRTIVTQRPGAARYSSLRQLNHSQVANIV